jgi:hypothetical protein
VSEPWVRTTGVHPAKPVAGDTEKEPFGAWVSATTTVRVTTVRLPASSVTVTTGWWTAFSGA